METVGRAKYGGVTIPLLFQAAPHLAQQKKIAWVPLVNGPTPVYRLEATADFLAHTRLYIKREDATDTLYGGNKVRNLEFLLGTAAARGARQVATVAPYGSNFVAAMAAQAKRVGLASEVFHFIPSRSDQMEMHSRFSAQQGMKVNVVSGGKFLGAAKAQILLQAKNFLSRETALLPPGGSSAIGALGHVNAIFELAGQIRAGEIPEPDLLVVGAGTCGTMAGLLAGIQLTGLKTKVIGVRCVDPIFCNPMHIAHIANGVLRVMRSRSRIPFSAIDLRDPARGLAYGEPLAFAGELIERVRSRFGIELDTTYSTKVFAYLQALANARRLRGLEVLYWHTYSPAANRRDAEGTRKALHATA